MLNSLHTRGISPLYARPQTSSSKPLPLGHGSFVAAGAGVLGQPCPYPTPCSHLVQRGQKLGHCTSFIHQCPFQSSWQQAGAVASFSGPGQGWPAHFRMSMPGRQGHCVSPALHQRPLYGSVFLGPESSHQPYWPSSSCDLNKRFQCAFMWARPRHSPRSPGKGLGT